MKRLAILGASGHGKVAAEIAELSGWSEIVFFDDTFPLVSSIAVWPVQGNSTTLLNSLNEFDGCIVAIGNNEIRLKKTLEIKSYQGILVSLVHPSSVISRYSKFGLGSVFMAGTIINPFSTLGLACIVNSGATIDHDCELGDAVHISPGANIAGAVKIGEKSWVGIGASVKQCISIGSNVVVGSGAAVVTDISNDVTIVGVPAKIKK